MQTQSPLIIAVALLCAEMSLVGKSCLAEGDSSHRAAPSAAAASGSNMFLFGGGGYALSPPVYGDDWRAIYNTNDALRIALGDYYNARRSRVYSADGISGWDTFQKGPLPRRFHVERFGLDDLGADSAERQNGRFRDLGGLPVGALHLMLTISKCR